MREATAQVIYWLNLICIWALLEIFDVARLCIEDVEIDGRHSFFKSKPHDEYNKSF